ncbi:YbjQ family protein [Amycolatopsis sp. H20-H5]|uniref:YbjQ family protein n=1 Tax=Amycolatopsis sp. H20-H5 TaxID=3046309 RepID=UPI002DB84F48|nr:heavy metal-binding domain-containing protein [Amycolatopsis sp. H20-H5]MEC3975242.1 heavy metal-binding domain-containing protein [Amycolatopsis sp. H20-H5]
MADWDGRGLPPVARARVERFASSGLRTSLLSVPATVGIETAGFTPVGEVMGCIVQSVSPVLGLGGTMAGVSMEPYEASLRRGYGTALDRLKQEAAAIGADGVVGITFTTTNVTENAREFVALGTAVRAETPQRPGRLFTTELAGQDVAKLLLSGWVPVSVAIGVSALAEYLYNAQLNSGWGGNFEVESYTRLITRVRSAARGQFAGRIRESGADGAIVSRMGLDTWRLGEVAVAARSIVIGTAVTRFHRGPAVRPATLTMLPVRQR